MRNQKRYFFEMSENMKILDTGTNTTKYLISFSYRIGTVQYSTVQYSTENTQTGYSRILIRVSISAQDPAT